MTGAVVFSAILADGKISVAFECNGEVSMRVMGSMLGAIAGGSASAFRSLAEKAVALGGTPEDLRVMNDAYMHQMTEQAKVPPDNDRYLFRELGDRPSS